jgi:hypothetical protein
MRIEHFKAEHLVEITKMAQHEFIGPPITLQHIVTIEQRSVRAITGFVGETPVFCGGLVEHWPGRYEAWAYMPQISGKHFVAVHRACVRFLELGDEPRIEAAVRADFAQANKWMPLLGFKLETPEPMARYGVDGAAHYMYSLVR